MSSSIETAKFYDNLMDGTEKRGIFGKSLRYNPAHVLQKPSVKKYFVDVIKSYLKKTDNVLDFGCGPGSFLAASAPFCGEITGVDISQGFVSTCQQTIDDLRIYNAKAMHIRPDVVPFADNTFDVIMMVGTIHHLENVKKSIEEALRVVKKGGRILIFEPNKLNPLIWLVHFLDKNERGLLKLGTPWKYQKILATYMHIEHIKFNGIVIGPESPVYHVSAEIINYRFLKYLLRWMNPQMFITGIKK